jgi:hypothetical protein
LAPPKKGIARDRGTKSSPAALISAKAGAKVDAYF